MATASPMYGVHAPWIFDVYDILVKLRRCVGWQAWERGLLPQAS